MPRPNDCIQGKFYKFHRDRPNREIGKMIPRPFAVCRLHRRQNVYMPCGSDARAPAKDVQKGKAEWEDAHPSGYNPHYHPADNHDVYGHVFYGKSGYREDDNRR